MAFTKKEDKDLSKCTFASLEKEHPIQKSVEELMREANKLIRCQITCNDPNKVALSGEIFCARNAILPEIKKFIQFGVPTHVPQILLNFIKEKQLQIFRPKKNSQGIDVMETQQIPMYNVTELPPLTKEEFESIKKKQIAEGYKGGEEL